MKVAGCELRFLNFKLLKSNYRRMHYRKLITILLITLFTWNYPTNTPFRFFHIPFITRYKMHMYMEN